MPPKEAGKVGLLRTLPAQLGTSQRQPDVILPIC